MEKPWLKFYDPGVPHDIDVPSTPVFKILDDAADEFPNKAAIFFFGGKVNYASLRHQANQFARALAGIGFNPGGRIGMILPNMPQSVISFYGTLKAGGTAVFFDPLSEEDELERRVNDSSVEALVVLDLILPRVDPIFARTKVKHFIIAAVKEFLPFPRNVLFSLGTKARGIAVRIAKKENVHLFRDFLLSGAAPGQTAETGASSRAEDAAVIQYAGDTSQAKGAVLTHKNLLANLKQISSWIEPERGKEIVLSISPFHESYGITLAMNLPVFLGGLSIQQPKFEEPQAVTAIKKIHPTIFPALSFMIQPLTTNPDFTGRPFGVKTTLSTGAPIPVEVVERYERQTGGKICECYGLAEASALTHANPVGQKRKTGSIGLPLPGTEAKIVDPATGEKDMPAGEPGELAVRGPQIMKGYWNRGKETGQVLREGWLYTGDQARMDEDGFFFLLGKVKK